MEIERYQSLIDLGEYALVKFSADELKTLRFELSIVLAQTGRVLPMAEQFLADTDE